MSLQTKTDDSYLLDTRINLDALPEGKSGWEGIRLDMKNGHIMAGVRPDMLSGATLM